MLYKPSQDVSELFEQLNDVMNDWQDLSYKPNSINQIEDKLERFYKDNHIDVNDVGRFDSDVKMTEEQINELYDIAVMASKQDIYLEDFEAKFEKAKGKADIETLEDYAEFVDNKTQFEDSVLSSTKMSYYEYEDLLEHALKDKRRTEKGVQDLIIEAFTQKGKTGNDLYDYIWNKTRKRR